MSAFEDYFTRIICINRESRRDRWAHVLDQCRRYGLERVERFEAHDAVKIDGVVNGNAGCTASHRGVFELICHNGWQRTLILEDDFEFVHEDFHARFEAMIPEVPTDWDALFIGAHYAEVPLARVSPHVIRCGRLHTTSSYAVTQSFARRVCPHISGIGPIDSLLSNFYRESKVYCFDPRLAIQYTNYSDLMEQEQNNSFCMLDSHHVGQLDKLNTPTT